MRSSYKKLGPYIREIDIRNKSGREDGLLGLSVQKTFLPTKANTIGTDFKGYKLIQKGQFAYTPDTSRRGDKIAIALLDSQDQAMLSPIYTVFEVTNENELLPEYLMMWFRRPEFDRYARYKSHGSVREIFGWDEMCDVELPVPPLKKQREIVREYHTIVDRIKLNEQLNQKLEETARAIYKQWFEDFEFPISKECAASIGRPDLEGKPYKSSGGPMIWNDKFSCAIPHKWNNGTFLDHAKIVMGQSPKGDSYNIDGLGMPLINGPVEFGDYFTNKVKWTISPTKTCDKGDLIICVRGSTTGRFVKSDDKYCLGRGVCSFKGKISQYFVDLLFKENLNSMLTLTTGSTFPNWRREELESFSIIVPDKYVISSFDQIVSKIFHKVENTSKEIISLSKFINLILQKMTKVEA